MERRVSNFYMCIRSLALRRLRWRRRRRHRAAAEADYNFMLYVIIFLCSHFFIIFNMFLCGLSLTLWYSFTLHAQKQNEWNEMKKKKLKSGQQKQWSEEIKKIIIIIIHRAVGRRYNCRTPNTPRKLSTLVYLQFTRGTDKKNENKMPTLAHYIFIQSEISEFKFIYRHKYSCRSSSSSASSTSSSASLPMSSFCNSLHTVTKCRYSTSKMHIKW